MERKYVVSRQVDGTYTVVYQVREEVSHHATAHEALTVAHRYEQMHKLSRIRTADTQEERDQ